MQLVWVMLLCSSFRCASHWASCGTIRAGQLPMGFVVYSCMYRRVVGSYIAVQRICIMAV